MIIIYLLYWLPLGIAIHITNLDFLIKLDKHFELLLSVLPTKCIGSWYVSHKICLNSSIVQSWMLIQMDSNTFHHLHLQFSQKCRGQLGLFNFLSVQSTLYMQKGDIINLWDFCNILLGVFFESIYLQEN